MTATENTKNLLAGQKAMYTIPNLSEAKTEFWNDKSAENLRQRYSR